MRKQYRNTVTGKFVKVYEAKANPRETVTETVKEISLSDAVEVLCNNLRSDPELYFAYQSNIAMAFVDEAHKSFPDDKSRLLEIGNQAAKNFLDLLINQK